MHHPHSSSTKQTLYIAWTCLFCLLNLRKQIRISSFSHSNRAPISWVEYSGISYLKFQNKLPIFWLVTKNEYKVQVFISQCCPALFPTQSPDRPDTLMGALLLHDLDILFQSWPAYLDSKSCTYPPCTSMIWALFVQLEFLLQVLRHSLSCPLWAHSHGWALCSEWLRRPHQWLALVKQASNAQTPVCDMQRCTSNIFAYDMSRSICLNFCFKMF